MPSPTPAWVTLAPIVISLLALVYARRSANEAKRMRQVAEASLAAARATVSVTVDVDQKSRTATVKALNTGGQPMQTKAAHAVGMDGSVVLDLTPTGGKSVRGVVLMPGIEQRWTFDLIQCSTRFRDERDEFPLGEGHFALEEWFHLTLETVDEHLCPAENVMFNAYWYARREDDNPKWGRTAFRQGVSLFGGFIYH